MGKELTESLYEIAPHLRVLMEAEEFDSEEFDALTEKFETKAQGLTHFIGELSGFADMAKAEAARITARAKAAQNRADSLKAYLKGCMEEAEILELNFGTKKLKIVNNPPKLIIDKEELIPAMFKTVETIVKIDKAAIKKAQKKYPVDGCHQESGTSLRIK